MKILKECFSFKGPGYEYKYNYVKDASGALRLDPLPPDEIIPDFYSSNYGNYSIGGNLYSNAKIKIAKWRYEYLQKKTFLNFIHKGAAVAVETVLGSRLTPSLGIPFCLNENAKILDIGYGGGEYLLALSARGFSNLCGYDIEQNFNSGKMLEANIQIYSGDINAIGIPDDSLDLVRLEHVFEHLKYPDHYLDVIYRKLKKGGRIVMTYPTYNNFAFYAHPIRFAHLDTPRHIFLHNKQSSNEYLIKHNFKVIISEYQPCFNVYTASQPFFYNKKRLKKGVDIVFGFLYYFICKRLGMGEQYNIYAIK